MSLLTATVKFRSENRGLKVIRQQHLEQPTASGQWVTIVPEVSYQFELGWLEVEHGQDMLPDGPFDVETGGPMVQDAAEWLRSFAQINGRFEEIVPDVPDSGPVLLAIAEAQLAGDVELVKALGDEEAATWQRPEVLARARMAYDVLDPPKKKE